jgi:hypothetical protein
VLYFDCYSGAAGDMVLGALLDAGLPLEELQAALGAMLPPGARLRADRVIKRGIAATKFRLIPPPRGAAAGSATEADRGKPPAPAAAHGADGHTHEQAHSPEGTPAPVRPPATPHAHGHRTMAEIHTLIAASGLSAGARAKAGELFDRLAEAEASVHQVPIERVHLHEVGALDSIVDIVGSVFALEWFGVDRIVSSPLNVGSGTVETAHGILPVPAPATLRLLEGVPVYSTGDDGELVTPTGALLVTGHADAFGPMPAMAVEKIGYGAGDRELPNQANVLRVTIGRAGDGARADAAADADERVVVLECEIDDMSPQLFGGVMDRLHDAGALDVFFTPVQMKKNRPGTLVTVLAPPERREALHAIIFSETTTIGVRWHEAARERLERQSVEVTTPHGVARVKVAHRHGVAVNALPEFDDCARLAAKAGVSVKDVQALVMQAYLNGLSPKA